MIRFRPLPWLTVFTLLGLIALIGLGRWQWQRYEEKRALGAAGIQTVTLVSFSPVKGQIQLVYGLIEGKPVWRVFAPVSSDREITFIDTGALPGIEPPDWRTVAEPFTGEAAIRGVPIHPRPRSIFAASPDPKRHVWYALDLPAMVKAVGGRYGASYYVAAPYVGPTGALAPNPFARPNAGDPLPPERHLGYAITWWGLAAALLAVYVVYHMNAGRLSFGRR